MDRARVDGSSSNAAYLDANLPPSPPSPCRRVEVYCLTFRDWVSGFEVLDLGFKCPHLMFFIRLGCDSSLLS